MRQGEPDFQVFHHDLYRAVGRGRWWVMEQQPGPVNWAPWNPDPLSGMARLWAWETFAHDAEAVCYFRWRQAPFAQEQMHAGLLRPDSMPAPAYDEAAQAAHELAEMPDVSTARTDVAPVFDYASAWAWETQPQGRDFGYFRFVFESYRALRRLGLNINILPPDCADLSRYKLLLAPGVATLSQPFLNALASCKGIALIGPRSNAKRSEFSIPVPLPPNLPGMTATVARVESLPPALIVPLAIGGQFLHWREKIKTTDRVIEATADGWPALICAQGIHYLAGWPDDAALARLLTALCHKAGIETDPLPEGLRRRDTEMHRFLFNYNAFNVEWDGKIIPAAGVFLQKIPPH